MRLYSFLYSIISIFKNKKYSNDHCITFSIGDGPGCQYMCDYCAENLGTIDFYFTDWICTNKNGVCTGEPMPWETYTCCTK